MGKKRNFTCAKNKNFMRNQLISQMRLDGLSYAKIGEKFGLSRQRVHQILKMENENEGD